MALDLIPLGTMTLSIARSHRISHAPVGTRVILELGAVRWEGERVNAKLAGVAAADWVSVGPDGIGSPDARFTLETASGALIFVQLIGRVDARGGMGNAPAFVALRFEAGDPELAWLNNVLAVGKSEVSGSEVRLEIAELA
jgi:uncharacterized protein DUF3237